MEVPLRNLRPSVIYSVPCDRIVQINKGPIVHLFFHLLDHVVVHISVCIGGVKSIECQNINIGGGGEISLEKK